MRLRYLAAILCIVVAFVAEHAFAQAEKVSFDSEVLPLFEKHCYECHHPAETGGGLDLTQLSTMLRGGDDLGPAIVPGKPGESPLIHVLNKGSEYLMPKDRDPLSKDEISLLKKWIAEGAVDDTPTFAVDEIAFFKSEVRPILFEHCLECHTGNDAESGLQLTSRHGTLRGGDRGPAAIPGDPSSSLMLAAVKHAGKLKMPGGGDRLTDDQVAALETWIQKGLPWPGDDRVLAREKPTIISDAGDHWAFQPLATPASPSAVLEEGQAAHPIDRFIDAKLGALGLTANGPASRSVLIRRATFDLIGLPPTPGETAEFVNDTASLGEAFAKVVERLLASEHYGERWGRHWLDLARYADTSGDAADAPIPEAHLYRDYVINSFNDDLPYDAFLVEQIAGDLLVKREPKTRARERIIATGYIALARRFNNAAYNSMHLVVDNTLDTIGGGVLGMSLGCARCHDHKFDGITTKEYYGLAGYFHSTQYPHAGTEHHRQRLNFVELEGGGIAYAVTDKKDASEIGNTRVHIQGEPKDLGEVAVRGFLPAITPMAAHQAEIPEAESGRLQLAQWIASADNPLTARVMANRIWQYHFGVGIVSTSNFFGMQGEPPSHPDLLDWLAKRFIDEGWSVKQMHRLMMSSRTYQQSAEVSVALLAGDPDNRLLGSYRHRRLGAEPMRDAVLAVSGLLDRGNPGPHDFPQPNAKNEYPYSQHRPFFVDYNHNYRTVYLPARRLGKNPYMENFNGPDTNVCTANRSVSTVPLQSLFWMNSDFIQENAAAFAARLARLEAGSEKRIELAYQLALNRAPHEKEVAAAMNYLEEYAAKITDEGAAVGIERAWTSFCRVLFASNEFIYVQ